ncbi:MAG TPA: LysE family transporter [Acidobacteriaceae bacterium]|jgi:putative LysE/RhtB family amino acid efflux pump
MFDSIAKGLWLGFCIAAPVGPIGTLVLKQSLTRGFRAGFTSGLGAALADLCYGALAAAGIHFAAAYSRPIAVVGGAVLLWLAWRSWHEPAPAADLKTREGNLRNFATTFLLTLSNPMTILSFAALIASTGSAAPGWFVLGVFSGSLLWWLILCAGASSLAPYLAHRGAILNRVAAVTLATFGLWTLYTRILKPLLG